MTKLLPAMALVLGACPGPVDPGPEPDVELRGPSDVSPSGTEGWLVLHARDGVRETEWFLDDDGERWLGDLAPVDEARLEWWVEGPGDARVELLRPDWPSYPDHDYRVPASTLPPGAWSWHVAVDGEELASGAFTVTGEGQDDTFEPATLDGSIWAMEYDGQGAVWSGPWGYEEFVQPAFFQLALAGEQVDVIAYTSMNEQLCRVWTGTGTVDDGGFLRVAVEDASFGPLPLYGGELRMGLGEAAAVGTGIEALVDVSPLDASFSDPEGPTVDGAACDTLATSGVTCVPCPDGQAGDCVTIRTFGGIASASTEEGVLGSSGFDALDDVPACDLPAQGAFDFDLSCSVLGTAGMGAWFLGIGALLLRRRRKEAA